VPPPARRNTAPRTTTRTTPPAIPSLMRRPRRWLPGSDACLVQGKPKPARARHCAVTAAALLQVPWKVVGVDQRCPAVRQAAGRVRAGTLAGDMVALMDALGHQRFAMVGHDVGMRVGYALAADHPDRLGRWPWPRLRCRACPRHRPVRQRAGQPPAVALSRPSTGSPR